MWGWMKSGGFPGLQNQCDLTTSGWVGSIPIHSRHLASARSLAVSLVVAALACATTAGAQRPDTSRVRSQRPDTAAADSVKPPLSPRRAFLYSALIPGSAQSILGRHRAAAVMLLIESMAIAMLRESAADVREARRMSGDNVVVSYVDPNTGAALTTPDTTVRRFDPAYVHVRQTHVEDWAAFIVANHLFSGADAFVAASLWDVPAQLSLRVGPSGARIGATLTW
jgi:hypothetical protein